jgi:hypothetical protein
MDDTLLKLHLAAWVPIEIRELERQGGAQDWHFEAAQNGCGCCERNQGRMNRSSLRSGSRHVTRSLSWSSAWQSCPLCPVASVPLAAISRHVIQESEQGRGKLRHA